jgi:hypothetical protein
MLADGGYLKELPVEETKLRFLVSWTEAELNDYITRFGVDNWIIYWYLKPNWVAVVEYSLFLVAVTLMISSLV